MRLGLYFRRKSKWNGLPYVQIFMALYLDSETHKGFKMFVAWSDNFSKDTKDIFTDLPYGAIQRLNLLQGGAIAPPGLLGGTVDSGEDTSRNEKRPHSYSGTPSLYLESPKGPILSSASTVNDTGLPLQFCL